MKFVHNLCLLEITKSEQFTDKNLKTCLNILVIYAREASCKNIEYLRVL